MHLIKSLAASAAATALVAAAAFMTDDARAQSQSALAVKDANSASQNLCAFTTLTGGSLTDCADLYINGAPVSATNPVFVVASGAVASVSAAINVATATTTQLVAGVSAQKIYVSSYDMIAGGTDTVAWEYGTGTTCGTNTTVLTGAYPLTSQVGVAPSAGGGPALFTIPAGASLCLVTSAAVQLSGRVTYVQQ